MAYEASSAQAKMLFLPENFHFFRSPSSISPEYEYLDGKIINNYKELAQKTNLWLSLGGFQEKIPSSSKIYNTHIIINNFGEIISKYRKLHLFDVQVNSENSLKESDHTEYGSLIEDPIDSPIGKLGL